ncbi:MAG: thiol:disulfide interchange protein DsbA/DsbL [Metallibacterium scheffleri]|jgi:thiol:disulfide interchange protein DsbA|uniref:thiol:disulfide interchange protein DsbA/DsbL n=1 Tax=Metallibacterium scheffleri TaxID=993689 RepID=UPI0026EFC0A0|nr:thiol:disulfide interchange protein DsbA/DsbL [Metallibacterium scheffleri]MCK9366071.1 thiol:disulfide interchange protein DsbA/DsbL [Metallibacterium scheffleri]
MSKSLIPAAALALLLAGCSSSQPPSGSAASMAAPAPAASAAPTVTAGTAPAAAASTAPTVAASAPGAASTASAGGTPVAAPADTGKWVEGKNYFRIEPAVPTDHADHVVVTEVFSWGCPACNQFEPMADAIRKSMPAYVHWQYLPAAFIPPEDWPTFQRAYYTAQALGLDNPTTHDAMFKAIWTPGGPLNTYDGLGTSQPHIKKNLPSIADIARFYAKHGGDAATFEATADSFAVRAKMKRADQLIKAYGVDSTPTIVVNGAYRLSVASAGGLAQTQELVHYLAQKEAAVMHLQQ